ncbi:nitroreductase family protein [Cohnella cellulosilytica]|uniref:Putative NAD(P)H nitroreductase n=1 Tax=Cohnella cellulosilytica TaxID=986710 RepID=A0ABW2FFW3_9BACL
MSTDDYPVAETLRQRRTIRQFKPDPIPFALLLELLDIANWAPNHGLREPWRYILYRGEARSDFTEAVLGSMSAEDKAKYAEQRTRDYAVIPCHLIVVMKEDPRQKQWEEDFGAACGWIQSFQLAAWERGIGVVWKTNPYIYSPYFRRAVGVTDGEKVVGVLHVGYPDLVPAPRPRSPAESKLTVRG